MPSFELKGKLALDGSKWNSGLKQAEGKAARFKEKINSTFKGQFAAAFGVSAITAAMKGVIDKAGQIKATADQLGLTAEQVQVLSGTLKEGGATIEDFSGAQRGLANSMKAASEGSALAADKFLKFGIGIQDIKKMNPTEMMFALAKQVKAGGGSFTELADAQALAGEQMAKLLPIMHNGLGVMTEDFKKFGVLSTETVDNLAEIGNQMARTFNNMAPALAFFVTLLNHVVVSLNELGKFLPTSIAARLAGSVAGGGSVKDFLKTDPGVMGSAADKTLESGRLFLNTMTNIRGTNVQGINPPGIQGADQAQRYEKWQRDMAKDIAIIRKQMESATR